jgi:hypothetical protein
MTASAGLTVQRKAARVAAFLLMVKRSAILVAGYGFFDVADDFGSGGGGLDASHTRTQAADFADGYEAAG